MTGATDGGGTGGHVNTPFDDILDDLDRHGGDGEVSVGTIQREIGEKALGAFLFLPAILEISPLGGVPGVPSFLAAIIAIVAVQVLIGRHRLWLPGFVERAHVSGSKLCTAVRYLRGPARFIDRFFHDRLRALTTAPFDRIVALVCLALTLTVPPLELIPFATTIPMATIALLGLALLFDDGLLVIAGLTLALGGMGLVAYEVLL